MEHQEDDRFKRTEGWIDNVEQKILSTISFKNRKEKTEIQTLEQRDSKTYAVNSNHLFPRENEHKLTQDFDEIGACVFTVRDKGCKFAASEIK